MYEIKTTKITKAQKIKWKLIKSKHACIKNY